ncbi:GGDEF domain-containing protein [Kineobactrum salinum]|uniref:diguanylate cyclase n=1 Tax=Kineobactrum salinum TaxID=2708301 RepID=A0A6C0U0L3_9GAMM|nr:GGDEF domain-containing protein [Kineobactrum salinum]QIB65652.1 diguanylate cyclase [Kineobactrum salinum]
MDTAKRGKPFLLAVLLSLAPLATAADGDIQQRLDLAEQLRTSDPGRVAQLLEGLEAEPLAPPQQHQLGFLRAYLLAMRGRLEEAIALVDELRTSPYPETRIKVHLLLANMHESIKDFSAAYTYLYHALSAVGSVQDSALRANVYTVATQLNISAGSYQRAHEYALAIRDTSDQPRHVCISRALELHALVRLQNSYPPDLAEAAWQDCERADELLVAHTTRVYTAEADVQHSPRQVRDSMQQTLPALERIGFPYTIVKARYWLARAQLELGEPAAAQRLLEDVYRQAGELGDRKITSQALLFLARIYEQGGQAEQALDTYKAHIKSLNKYISEFSERNIAHHMAQTDYMENRNRMELLTSENELLQLEARVQRNEKLMSVAGGSVLIGFMLLVMIGLNRKKTQLDALASTDFLTQTYNRRYFTELVDRRLKEPKADNYYSLVIFDIDNFKIVNDQHGHAAGDEILRTLARVCHEHIRQEDILARIGGEEFALFLPGCAQTNAVQIADQCRRAIADTVVPCGDLNLSVTASFGVATTSLEVSSFEALFKQADDALYRSKGRGRNCINVAPWSPTTTCASV